MPTPPGSGRPGLSAGWARQRVGRGIAAGSAASARRRTREARPRQPPGETPPELREPLKTLGLSLPTALDAVKTRYKELAKRHHPDANGGDRAAEERLKTINLAYAAVRSRLMPAPSNMAAAGGTRRSCAIAQVRLFADQQEPPSR